MALNGISKAPPVAAPLPGARAALTLLLAINLFNYIDRYVLAAVAPHVRVHLLTWDDPKANTKIGALFMAFLLSYTLLAPLFGWFGDQSRRWALVGVAVILWSLASGASGLAVTFMALLLTRCFVGVGEAAYGPVAPTLLSDMYPVSVRGGILACFYCAIPVGSALGYALGGQVAGPAPAWPTVAATAAALGHAGSSAAIASCVPFVSVLDPPGLGWRWAFYLVVGPGLLLGGLCFLMREPARGHSDDSNQQTTPRTWRGYLPLLEIRSYVHCTLGMTAMTFAFGGLAAWMPTYLVEECPGAALGPIEPATAFGGITALAGLLATLAGGIAGDRLRNRYPGSYFLVSGVTMLIGFPMVLLVLITPVPWKWLVIFATVFCLFFNTGPSNTILANVTPPTVRAGAFAITIFVIHAFGDVISPLVIGYIRDLDPHRRLAPGFVLVSIMILVGGLIWLRGARHLAEDTRRAPLWRDPRLAG